MAESTKARAAFEEYCALGPERSLAKLAVKVGRSTGYVRQLERWSSEGQWVERAKQFDRERAEEKRRKQDAEIERMNERHAMIGTTQQAKAIKQIEELIAAKKFGSQASVQLLKLATDIERLARGAPTEHIEQSNAATTEWSGVYATVTRVLKTFPEAALAVAEALEQLEQGT